MEARSMETRTVGRGFEETLNASVNVLQDQGYTLDTVDADVGLITASRRTESEQGEIFEEAEDGGAPVWAKVVGVVLVVGLVVMVASAFSDEDDGCGCCDCDDDVDYHYYSCDDADDWATVYEYRVTVNFHEENEAYTRVRVSCQGTRYEGGKMVAAGPVHDPGFFHRFFAGLDNALALEKTNTENTEQTLSADCADCTDSEEPRRVCSTSRPSDQASGFGTALAWNGTCFQVRRAAQAVA
jgi:hypothetical protein